ncbi:MAG: extracellular solute-binding protein [Cyanobacteria bacterium J06554_6]
MPRRFPIRSATRRRFLQGSAAALAGVALSNCQGGGVSDVQSDASGETASGGDDGKLYIYTWADYTDDEVVQQFTEATGIEVEIDLYESNEAMLAKMQAGGGDKYSLIYPSDYMVAEMRDLELLTAIDAARVEGMDRLVDNWQSPAYDPDNGYSIPYSWGTTGLIYNTAELATPIKDWADVWLNMDQLDRRITLLDDVRETMGASLKSLGYSVNSTDPGELEAAYRKLLELKPALSAFKSFGWQEELLGGDLLVSHAYSVEAIPATEEDENLDYIVPESGAVIWTDTMVIPNTAPNVDAAYQWINFNLQPEVSKGLVERLSIATPNGKTLEILSPELLGNTDLFPSEDVLARCEALGPVGETGELYDQYWNQLTSA